MACHTNFVLDATTRQLNRSHNDKGRLANSLQTANKIDSFKAANLFRNPAAETRLICPRGRHGHRSPVQFRSPV